MTINDVIEKIEQFAPLSISRELISKGSYDNSGFLIGDKNVEVDGAVIAIDLCNDAVDLALEEGCNLIITHHPFIYSPLSSVTEDDYKGRLVRRLIQNGISVYSSHLPSDMTKGGIDDLFAAEFKGTVKNKLLDEETYSYGKISEIKPKTLGELVEELKEKFSFVHFVGETDKTVSRVATFCGKASGKDVSFAIKEKADLFVSCDIDHQHIVELKECGISVIELLHGESEFYYFKKIYEKLDIGIKKYVCETDFRLI